MPNIKGIEKLVFYSKQDPLALAKMLYDNIPSLQDLVGVVSITGTLAFGSELTADVTEITNNTGTLSYVWRRDGVAISTATQAKYTLVAADIDKTISVEVTSDVQKEALIAVADSKIAKANQDAPTGLTGGTGEITGLNATKLYEYIALPDGEDYVAVTASATSITELTAGIYAVRFAGSTTAYPSNAVEITVS